MKYNRFSENDLTACKQKKKMEWVQNKHRNEWKHKTIEKNSMCVIISKRQN